MQDIDISSPRPLNDVLSEIEDTQGVPIDFQEEIIRDSKYLIHGAEVGLDPSKAYPRGGRLLVHFVPGESSVLAAVQSAVSAYERAGLPGSYKVALEGEAIDVHPSSAPLSQVRISIPDQARTSADTVQVIADEVTRASGNKVEPLNLPYTAHERLRLHADRERLIDIFGQFS